MIELAPVSKNRMTYEDAELYCQLLVIDGKTDWRLPTYSEWYNIQGILWWYDGCSNGIPKMLFVCPVRDI
jgi:hypothetical protein